MTDTKSEEKKTLFHKDVKTGFSYKRLPPEQPEPRRCAEQCRHAHKYRTLLCKQEKEKSERKRDHEQEFKGRMVVWSKFFCELILVYAILYTGITFEQVKIILVGLSLVYLPFYISYSIMDKAIMDYLIIILIFLPPMLE